MSNSWRLDDLDGGLADNFSDLQGLGENLAANPQAYNMTDVLSLSIFKSEGDCSPLTTDDGSRHSQCLDNSLFNMNDGNLNGITKDDNERFAILLKAPPSPGRKIEEDTLTYLNQGQSTQLVLHCLNAHEQDGIVKCALSLGFLERKHQVFANSKFEEWSTSHPNEKMIEIDLPMSMGIHNICPIGRFSNRYEFEWDAFGQTRLFFKINCVSSEFTKGKSGGESGIILQLQLDVIQDELQTDRQFSYGCQVKVFKPKGADRKMKSERSKYDALSPVRQQPPTVTVLKRLTNHVNLTNDQSLCSSQFSQMNLSTMSLIQSPQSPPQIKSMAAIAMVQALTSDSSVEETQTWLAINRFHDYKATFSNFSGKDLLRLTKDELTGLCGLADGIRLNNALQSRASRPVLTIYISPTRNHDNSNSMEEYHAIFLDELTAFELKKKIILKCQLENVTDGRLFKQGPSNILIVVDDEMVQNLSDESHFRVTSTDDGQDNVSIILK